MSNKFVIAMVLVALFVVAILFIPAIFGSMESEINLTNNTTRAVYDTVTPFVITGQMLFWVAAILVILFLVVGILLMRRR